MTPLASSAKYGRHGRNRQGDGGDEVRASASTDMGVRPWMGARAWRPVVGTVHCRRIEILTIIVVLGAVLRLTSLGHRSLWLDEAALFWLAQGTASDVIRANATGNSAPPLFALLI